MQKPNFTTQSYFSESQQQWVHVDQMPLPYALNVFRKMMNEHKEEFAASLLCKTLMGKLRPSYRVLESQLRSRGEASFLLSDGTEVKSARARFYRLSKKLGVPVSTEVSGSFMRASCAPVGEKVTVNRV